MRYAPLAILCALATAAAAYPDKSLIRRQIRVNMPRFKYCYEKALAKNPGLEGRVIAKFAIGKDGSVVEASASGLPDVNECIAAVVKTIKFAPTGGGVMQVNYPFLFQSR